MTMLHRVLTDLAFDARYGVRSLRRYPAIAVAAVMTLSLGIGAVTAMFTLLDKTALRRLPVADPDRLVLMESFGFAAYLGRDTGNWFFPHAEFERFQKGSRTVGGVFATAALPRVSVKVGGRTDIGTVELVSGDYFSTLGVRPALGRVLVRADDRPDGTAVVISDRLWRRRFGADGGVIGTSISLNTAALTIVGVLPRDFSGLTTGLAPDVFLPLQLSRRLSIDQDQLPWVQVLGRLPGHVTTAQAAADFTRIYRDSSKSASPADGRVEDRPHDIRVRAVPRGIEGPAVAFTGALRLLFIAGVVLLVIACVNVVNLLLARAEVQRPERAVRTALGAGRGRLVRQALAESALIAVSGGAGGVALAIGATQLVSAMVATGPAGIVVDGRIDGRILAFALASTLATVLGCGLWPALRAPATLAPNRTVSAHLRANRILLGGQIALSLVLLSGALLFVQTARNHATVDGGYDRHNLLTFAANPTLAGYGSGKTVPVYAALLERVRAVPGVRSAAASLQPALNLESHLVGDVTAPTAGAQRVPIVANAVTPGYFSTLQIPLIQGRDFLEAERGNGDDPPTVAIISAALARRLFADESPIGRRITWGQQTTLEVVGVVGNTTYGRLSEARGEPRALVYLPLYQIGLDGPLTVTLRHDSSPAAIAGAARAAVAAVNPAIPVYEMRTFEQLVAASLLQQRLVAGVSTAFALVALLLASVGLYGLMAFAVTRREREIGVRMALGAGPRRVLRSTLFTAMTPVAFGLLIGIPAAYFVARLAEPFLFDVSPGDPATMAATTAVLLGVAALAAMLPARRASRVDPLVVLRAE